MGELVDLVTRYEPEVIWSDGDWEAPDSYWDAPANFLAWLVTNSSVKDTVVYNDRWGDGDSCKHGSFYSCQVRLRSCEPVRLAPAQLALATSPARPHAHMPANLPALSLLDSSSAATGPLQSRTKNQPQVGRRNDS